MRAALLGVLTLSGCMPMQPRIYTIEKGMHRPLPAPGLFGYWIVDDSRDMFFEAQFSPEALYVYADGDQQSSWMKGGGWSNSLFTNSRNAAMWAYRHYPASSDSIEIAAYWHINGERGWSEPLLRVCACDPVQVRIANFDEVTVWTVHFQGRTARYMVRGIANDGFLKKGIWLWHGGRRKSPVTYKVKQFVH